MLSVGLVGVMGHLVEVEADLSAGLPAVVMSGLPDTALNEARDRVRAAVVNSGERWPNRRITVNLLPATLPKHGSAFDMGIAAALLGAAGELPLAALDGVVILGELGLDGSVRPIRGVLPMVVAALRAGVHHAVVPLANAAEAAVVPGITVKAVETLHRLVAFVRSGAALLDPPADRPPPESPMPDLADVAGQALGRRAIEVAAAGGHHVAMFGPPGAGMPSDTVLLMITEYLSGYVRLSKEHGDTNVSLAGMVADVVAMAERYGYALAPHPGPDCPESCQGQPVHVDDGISGAVRNRPAFLAWLADGRSGAASALGTWHTDRLTREGVNAGALVLDVVEGKDPLTGRVVFPPVRFLGSDGTDSRDESAFRFRFVIDAEVGRAERARISARNRAKDARLRAAGRFAGGGAPYGYRVVPAPDGKGKALDIEPVEAAAIQQAASMILAEDGTTLGDVTRWMTANAPARRTSGWSRSTLKHCLTNYALTGAVMVRPRDAAGNRATNNRETQPLLDDAGNVVRPWPQILSPATVEAVRTALSGRRGGARRGAGRAPAHLLTNLMSCSGCGRPMNIWYARKRQYFCPSDRLSLFCPRRVSIQADIAEAYLVGLYLGAVGDNEMQAPVVTVAGGGERERVESELADVMRALSRQITPELVARITDLQTERDALAAMPVQRHTEWRPTGRTFREEWERRADDVLWRRSLLAEAFAELTVLPGRMPVAQRIRYRWSDIEPFATLAELKRDLEWYGG
ncbi:resolvase-like protein [Asanoa ferruginea]|uniref:Resolvase-like protein n=1 Tax=Asanoa ferruginea TaxID=53367 RepID=A0A3D9ZKV5_9ACTN|nr:resolvase-like protein [Asanoa ferruginea]